MKKYLIIFSAIIFLLVFAVLPKTIALAQFQTFEVYNPNCATGGNCTSYPLVKNVTKNVSTDNKSVDITAYVYDVSGVSSVIAKVRAEGSSNYINIGNSAKMQEFDGGSVNYETTIDISNTSVWQEGVTYFVDISATDNLNINSMKEAEKYTEATSFKLSSAPIETEAELWTDKQPAGWGNFPYGGYEDPYNVLYQNSRSQFIVTALDLTNVGLLPNATISAISLKTYQQPDRNLANFRVQAKLTTAVETTSWEGGWTELYGPTNVSRTDLVTTDPWKKYSFSQDFIWDGTSNIMFDISRNDNDSSVWGGMYKRQNVGDNRSASGRCDYCTTGYPDYTHVDLYQMINGNAYVVLSSDCPAMKITFTNQ